MTTDRLLTARDVRERCGNVSDMSLWRWVQAGTLPPPTMINGRKYWNESVVAKLVSEGSFKMKSSPIVANRLRERNNVNLLREAAEEAIAVLCSLGEGGSGTVKKIRAALTINNPKGKS